MRFNSLLLSAAAIALTAVPLSAQGQDRVYTRADTLRGSTTAPARTWWDVTFYDLHVRLNPSDSTIRGHNAITYQVVAPATEMQIDLMVPLVVDSMVQDGKALTFRRDGNAFFVKTQAPQPKDALKTITVYYSGRPRVAPRPPWEGGFSWEADSLGRPWMVTTDQGLGASVWWPNKDVQTEEPDSQRIAITVPDPLINVSNGRLRSTKRNGDGTTTYEWFVMNPINNYAIAVAAGNYAHFNEVYKGEDGDLTMDYWPIDYNLEKARRQFTQARTTMQCFEHWFGPYPWYKDGYKLIEVPNTGMEHQSAVTYGNWYENGYRRRDASGTGYGLKWDFIIVHETAHEWWGNNITTRDLADMWVHESFANYSEGIYTECLFGKDAGAAYIRGVRRGIRNDRPIIPDAYGVNAQGSGDMYPKGGNMLHMIRQLVDNDEKWRGILRGLNQTFRHQIVNGKQVENYISQQSGLDLSKVFDQYLRDVRIPVFEYRIEGNRLSYRWSNVVPGFAMPVRVTTAPNTMTLIRPTTEWQTMAVSIGKPDDFRVDENFYVNPRRTD